MKDFWEDIWSTANGNIIETMRYGSFYRTSIVDQKNFMFLYGCNSNNKEQARKKHWQITKSLLEKEEQ